MRVGLLTEGGYPHPGGEGPEWCDRLVRGLARHDFEIFEISDALGVSGDSGASGVPGVGGVSALRGTASRGAAASAGDRPGRVGRVRTASLSGRPAAAMGASRPYGRRERRRFAEHFGELAAAVGAASAAAAFGASVNGEGAGGAGEPGDDGGAHGLRGSRGPGSPGGPDRLGGAGRPGGSGGSTWLADRFASGLYGLAELARDAGGLSRALRSEDAVRLLEAACHAPGATGRAHGAHVGDLLTTTALLERALRPLSLDWYGGPDGDGGRGGDRGLAGVDLCHATTGGAVALPGLLAKRFFGTPLLVTEHDVRLRAHYLTPSSAPGGQAPAARSLLAAFHGLLAAEVYAAAALITCGDAHARRWQERCGADRARVRTVHPGLDARPYAEVGEGGADDDGRTLLWTGRIAPAKDLVGLLHAFALIRASEPDARLRIVGAPAPERGATAYLGRCRALAAELFPDEGTVSFEEPDGPGPALLADSCAAGSVVVLSSVAEGFPFPLAEAMFRGRATVSTDVGAVREVIGGTGLVVPPRDPHALAEACVDLLRAPERRARLGAAARARALELFTAERNTAAFHGIYLELVAHCPVRGASVGADGQPLPFARPAETHVPGHWSASASVSGRTARFRQWLPGSGTAVRTRQPAADESAAHVPGWARGAAGCEGASADALDRGPGAAEAVGASACRPESVRRSESARGPGAARGPEPSRRFEEDA
ncbi:glycosyltransferase [Streptomyces sp. NPDC050610]|uniref:glycosyltransferase n=1 Tax=Streptomyces sp. NPDC050610 TaxID=3157097 RepID=UPI00341572F9